MKIRNALLLSLFAATLFGSRINGLPAQEMPVKAALAQDVQWRRDYNDARREQDDKKLPLIIDFYTTRCMYCDKMDATTFRDPQVVQLMNHRFLSLKIDGERESKLAEMLGIANYPTTVIASADGKIITTMVGYQEPLRFLDVLQRISASQSAPDWMEQDLILARKWHHKGDFGLAIAALRKITEDGKSRPVQVEAQRLLQDIDGKASQTLVTVSEMVTQGKKSEAVKILTEIISQYPGTQASKEGKELLARIANSSSEDDRQMVRTRTARDILAQARDFYKKEEYILCLDRCFKLTDAYLDLPEGTEGMQLLQEVRNNPEWLQSASDTLYDRLGRIYLDLADSLLKKGQPQRAEFYLNRVIQSFPGSRLAESAQIRLGQLQGTQVKNNESK